MRTIQGDIDAVAGIISQWDTYPGDASMSARAQEVNASTGWTLTFNEPGGGYLWLDTVTLTDDELAYAVALAESWRRDG